MLVHHLTTRTGGTIISVDAVAHSTTRKVADWYFLCTINYEGEGTFPGRQVCPTQLCHDDTTEGKREVDRVLRELNEYLGRVGDWHKPKRMKDGRMVLWTPGYAAGQQLI